ncbi:hypothetical protein AB0G85_34895 [Streptomyces sioyaensis]|uniref:hypothetical protein n=1 Tax=Streptomyces sioyaensis TaxID=67364 RepID=UPI0033DA5A1C
MPIALILVSVLLQAGTEGFLSGRLDVTASLRFSTMAFLTTAITFTLVTWVRGRSGAKASAVPAPRGRVRRLLCEMNVASTVTFLGFYLSLAWVPAALAASLMAGVGPLAVVVIGAVRGTSPSRPASWVRAVILLAVSLTTASCIQPGSLRAAGLLVYAGGALAVLAGFGTAYLTMVSRSLGALGVDPARVMAHRFHLTYVLAGVILLLRAGDGVQGLSLGVTGLAAVIGVVVPLYLLQISIQRCPPIVTMVLLTALPGLTYVAQVMFGDPFRPLAAALVVVLVALTLCFALIEGRSRPGSRPGPRAGQGTRGDHTVRADRTAPADVPS